MRRPGGSASARIARAGERPGRRPAEADRPDRAFVGFAGKLSGGLGPLQPAGDRSRRGAARPGYATRKNAGRSGFLGRGPHPSLGTEGGSYLGRRRRRDRALAASRGTILKGNSAILRNGAGAETVDRQSRSVLAAALLETADAGRDRSISR